MGPDDILARLDTPHASYQWEAMDAAVEQQSALTPLLLQRLESAAADPEALLDTEGPGLLYKLVLVAHFRETGAQVPRRRAISGSLSFAGRPWPGNACPPYCANRSFDL